MCVNHAEPLHQDPPASSTPSSSAPSSSIRIGPLTIDHRRSIAAVGREVLVLTRSELDLLLYLYGRPDRVVPASEIVACVLRAAGADANARFHVWNLRRKLSLAGVPSDAVVKTVRGKGYTVELTAQE